MESYTSCWISTHQDAKVYLTLDTDHTMGMTAVGTSDDYESLITLPLHQYHLLNTSCNSVTNSSYQYFGGDDAFGSVLVDMLGIYELTTIIKSYLQDNYLIIKSENNYNYIVIM